MVNKNICKEKERQGRAASMKTGKATGKAMALLLTALLLITGSAAAFAADDAAADQNAGGANATSGAEANAQSAETSQGAEATTQSTGTGTADQSDVVWDHPEWNSYNAYPTDIVNTDYFPAVKFLVDRKLVTGYGDGKFYPESTITRAEYLKIIILATNNETRDYGYQNKVFSDIAGHWAEEYIKTAVGIGLVNGFPDGTFRPNSEVTYAEVIAIFARTKGVTADQLSGYGKWPENYATYATMYNLVGDLKITDWNAPATRGNVAKILYLNLPKNGYIDITDIIE